MNPALLFARCLRVPALVLAGSLGALGEQGPVHEWRFVPGSVQGGKLRAAVGGLRGEMIGEYRLERDGELQFMRLLPSARNLKVGGILLSRENNEARLPAKAMTVEAWVQIDRSIEWGGILGAVHDTGTHERGWILGYGNNQFYFGLVAEKPARITYLRAAGSFVTGAWYHVAASYDGNEMRLYVDGQLSAQHTGQSGPILQPDSPFFTIGSYRDDDDYHPFSGKLERITLWHRTLPAEELANRFAKRKDEFPGIEEAVVERLGGPSDWPTWMGDNARSGRAGEALPVLSQEASWVHVPPHQPVPAWPETALSDYWRNRLTPEVPRVTFDWIHSVAVSDGRLFYGSSADDSLRCLDATTGKEQWSFIAGGPIRLAPTVTNNTVLFGCDDGAVYCLDARSGAFRWKARPPSARDERLPGNGRLISLWPVRTGVLVKDDAAYFGAGLFPAEGCWQCAVDIRTGRILSEKPVSISPQGYLAERDGNVVASTGRAPGGGAFATISKHRQQKSNALAPAVPIKGYPHASVMAGRMTYAGGNQSVAGFDEAGKKIWEAEVDGPARSLAAAAGRLFVSTESGRIYSFSSEGHSGAEVSPSPVPPTTKSTKVGQYLVKVLPRNRGYILVVGIKDGALIHELALSTAMKVVAVDRDESRVAALRRKMETKNWRNLTRPSIQHVNDYEKLPYVDGIFNLVTSEHRSLHLPGAEVQRLLRPYDGIAALNNQIHRAKEVPAAGGWTHIYGDPGNSASSGGDRLPDGPLRPQWFGAPGPHHMVDRHLRAPPPLAANGFLFVPGREYLFGIDAFNGTILWEQQIENFTRVAVLRDGGNLALAKDNSLYAAAGPDCLEIDVNTGNRLRKFSVEPESQEWGYLAIGGVNDELLIGSASPTGAIRRELATVSIFSGAYGDRQRIVCSESLFALSRKSGTRQWTYRPSGAIFNPSLCIHSGRIFFLESNEPQTLVVPGSHDGDRSDTVASGKAKRVAGRWHYSDLIESKGATIVALDLDSGKPLWRKPLELQSGIQTLFLSCAAKQLVVVDSRNGPSSAKDGRVTLHYDTQVHDPVNGKRRWQHTFDTGRGKDLTHGEQDLHPVITGEMLIVEPQVYQLATGKPLFTFRRSGGGGCGALSASASRLYYRASHPTTFDLQNRKQQKIANVSRPGCWINMIPASGLLLIPEGSSGCICSYPIQASMAFRPGPVVGSGENSDR